MSSLTPEDGRLRTKLRGLHSRLGKRKVGQARQTAIQTVIAHKSGDISVSDASSLDKAAPQSVTISSRPTSPPSTHETETPPSANLFSRLHALLPSGTNNNTPHSDSNTPAIPPTSPPKKCESIKVRIISWNMHDGLPSGDLEQLLGEIPPYRPTPFHGMRRMPDLGEDGGHPYHILVVAGQECPSASGLPMAFGAGYRIYEKDKKSPSKKTDGKHNSNASQQQHIDSHPIVSSSPDDPSSALGHSNSTNDLTLITHNAPHPGGWSYLLDDWLVRGNKIPRRKPTSGDPIPDLSPPEGDNKPRRDASSPPKPQADVHSEELEATSTIATPLLDRKDLRPRSVTEPVGTFPVSNFTGPNAPRRGTTLMGETEVTPAATDPPVVANVGPYELAAKERMMGIYLAVYVHRDAKSLIRGIDKDSVTAGLIGGRVGNKGGVAISMNLDGTTFLFVNAHLAAHGNRTQARMANLGKIKAELSLEHFLPSEDPRIFAEEITERYDHSFIFGDLNFRLDVSRLHADWLIGRKEYIQALTFDQLLALMKNGEFPGFREAPINFPPTFKYDVDLGDKAGRRKTVRRAIRKLNKERRALREWRKATGRDASRDDVGVLVEEGEIELGAGPEIAAENEGEGDDHTSFASTGLVLSCTEDGESSSSSEDDEGYVDEVTMSSAVVLAKNTAKNARGDRGGRGGIPEMIYSAQHHPAAQKAKAKWRSLLWTRKDNTRSQHKENEPAGGPAKRAGSPSKRSSAPSSPEQSDLPRPSTNFPRRFAPSKNTSGEMLDSLPRAKSTSTPPPAIAIEAPTDNTPLASTPDLPTTLSRIPSPEKSSLRPSFTRGTSSYTSVNVTSSTGAEQSPGTSNRSDKSAKREDSSDECDDDVPRPGRYDTSPKKRVPSWCDRIIFKTTVIPPPDEEPSAGLTDVKTRGSRGRRFGPLLLLTTFARPLRQSTPTKGSPTAPLPRTESLPDTPTITTSPVQMGPPSIRPVRSLPLTRAVFSNPSALQKSPSNPRSKRSCSLPQPGIARSQSSSSSLISESDARALLSPTSESRNSHPETSFSGNHSLFACSIPSRPSTSPVAVTTSPVASATRDVLPSPLSHRAPTSRRWFPFPSSLLPSSSGASSSNAVVQPTPSKKRRKKGDVNCLFYGTLDDQAMTRLKGKSDHRPVIGVYSVAI